MRLVLGTREGMITLENGRRDWSVSGPCLLGEQIMSLARDASGQTLYVGTHKGGLFRSTDQGKSWQPKSEGLTFQAAGNHAHESPLNLLREREGETGCSVKRHTSELASRAWLHVGKGDRLAPSWIIPICFFLADGAIILFLVLCQASDRLRSPITAGSSPRTPLDVG